VKIIHRLSALVVLGASAAISAAAPPHPIREVLPDDVTPVHYDLTLSPDAAALTFQGTVAITVEVHATTPRITLNAEGLTFERAAIDGGKDAAVTTNAKLGRATLDFGAAVAAGRHVLLIGYHGKIGRSTLGFFAMDYSGPDGPRRTLATNFEPAAARQLLPCWDEPARKATFTVSIDAPKDRMALSNMPVAEVTSLSPTMQRVRFAESPKMSTYLLFVGIGDFERVHKTVDGVDVGVVVKRGDTGKSAYALEQAALLLHYYNDYFGVAFPLPKLDLIAAPGQIAGGSMENWGAIFYSQNHVLFDPRNSTESDRRLVFLVVSHEMAHQWFGDLVTMAWWDDLWLNEGFARWMQTFAADDLHPEWETGIEAASVSEQGKAADALPSTHPVVQEVFTADQAAQSFDEITYDKGAAVITMLNAYVGRDKFRDGVRRYMRDHAFGNTVDTDLWRSVQTTVDKPVVDIERDFTRQEGVPLVRVARTSTGVRLSQARFGADPAAIARLAPQHWRMPLAVQRSGEEPHYLLLQGVADLAQPPLLVNVGQTSYARVLYDPKDLRGLSAQMGALKPADQLGLLNDALALGFAGYAPAGDVLTLAATLPANANPIVWRGVIAALTEIDVHYGDTAQRAAFRRFALGLLAPLAARLDTRNTPGQSANIEILRRTLTEAQGRFGDPAVLAWARERIAAGDGTPAEQRSALIIVAAHADPSSFDTLLSRASKTNDPLEKEHVLDALAGVSDPALASRMIEVALSTQAPAGTAPDLITHLSREHPDAVWAAVAPRLDDPALPFDKTTRWSIAGTIAGHSSQSRRISDLEAYEARSVPAEARKPFLGAAAAIRQNKRIASDVLPEIDRWVAARPASGSQLQSRDGLGAVESGDME
jgi:aminopeptidase N